MSKSLTFDKKNFKDSFSGTNDTPTLTVFV